MLIGEVSRRTGLSRDTIRFYEKQGLVTITHRNRRENNYKEYSEETVHRLNAIKHLKHFGFTLHEVVDLLELIEAKEATCRTVSEVIAKKVELLDTKIRDLLALRNQLVAQVQACQSCADPQKPGENCPILISPNDL